MLANWFEIRLFRVGLAEIHHLFLAFSSQRLALCYFEWPTLSPFSFQMFGQYFIVPSAP